MHGNRTASVVLAHGCFDLLHIGHIRHLRQARAMGDRLVVSVTGDAHVNKGMGRPRFTAAQRVEALSALDCVDEAFVNDAPDAVATIERLRPAVYVKGIDYAKGVAAVDAALGREIAAITDIGGRFATTTAEKWSSSRLLNGEQFDDRTLAYLDHARTAGFRDRILSAFDRADQLRIVFTGETIEDEYVYVSPLGKPAKETMLATVRSGGSELFLGGAMAAACHGDWLNAICVSPNVTIRKTRYVDRDFNRKLFEVYSARRIELGDEARAKFQCDLIAALRSADVAVVLDFGHGLMGPQEIHIAESAKFLAANAQSNAGNYGFNLVTKYRGPSYVCVDEPEARLATGMADGPIDSVLHELAISMVDADLIVTHGRYGCVHRRAGNLEVHKTPPFATHGIDTMGAGDAFLAVTAPLIAAGLDLEAAAFVGNVSGAIKVGIVGHRRHVARQELVQSIEALLA